jgi:hypothetical protein
MRTIRRATPAAAGVVIALAGPAHASEMTVTGMITDVTSRWTEDGSRIVTEATVHTDAGDVVVSQLGGSVGGIGMRQWPSPEPLVRGMRVTVAAREAFDLSARRHVVVDSTKVLEYPSGYVRTGPTEAGAYLYWSSGCVFITMDDAGSADVAGEIEFPVIQAALDTWNNGTASCSFMQLRNEGRRAMEVGRDNVNLIKFRDVSWCRPATKDDPARCHPESAAGITTATYVDDPQSTRDGQIVDADVELNGVNFSIAVNGQTLGSASCISDLQNTLTHELGHLLGLEHTCLAPGDPPRIDDTGGAVPSCNNATATIQEATMFNYQMCGEVKKATIEQDDIDAICGVYPMAEDPGACEKVDDDPGCCSATRDPRASLLMALLVGIGVVLPRGRRRRLR